MVNRGGRVSADMATLSKDLREGECGSWECLGTIQGHDSRACQLEHASGVKEFQGCCGTIFFMHYAYYSHWLIKN